MKKFLAKRIRRLAPRTTSNLRRLERLDPELQEGPSRFLAYERELRQLRREIDEMRRDNRRVAELYDVVFQWARENAAARGVTPVVDPAATRARVQQVVAERAAELASDDR